MRIYALGGSTLEMGELAFVLVIASFVSIAETVGMNWETAYKDPAVKRQLSFLRPAGINGGRKLPNKK